MIEAWEETCPWEFPATAVYWAVSSVEHLQRKTSETKKLQKCMFKKVLTKNLVLQNIVVFFCSFIWNLGNVDRCLRKYDTWGSALAYKVQESCNCFFFFFFEALRK